MCKGLMDAVFASGNPPADGDWVGCAALATFFDGCAESQFPTDMKDPNGKSLMYADVVKINARFCSACGKATVAWTSADQSAQCEKAGTAYEACTEEAFNALEFTSCNCDSGNGGGGSQ